MRPAPSTGMILKLLAGIFLLGISGPLEAQTTAVVSSNAGDQSTGSLGAAVTDLNNQGAGSISFQSGLDPVTLTQPLDPLSYSVTFEGSDAFVAGQAGSPARLLFNQAFTQNNSLVLQYEDAASPGLAASVTAASWVMDPGVYVNLDGGAGGGLSITGGSGAAGSNGGNASVAVGNWTIGQVAELNGGAGGSVTDTDGTGDQGGQGGAAFVAGNSVGLDNSILDLEGGSGGSVTDQGSGSPTGGTGGSASAAFNSVSIASDSQMWVDGGQGGVGTTGGRGGTATALLGGLSLSGSNLKVDGGNGGGGSSAGNGGDAFVSIGAFTGLPGATVNVQGGSGGGGSLGAGDGGGAVWEGGSVSWTGSGSFQVRGGNGTNLGPTAGGGAGGNGGSASVSLQDFSIGSGSVFQVAGGNGGSAASGAAAGDGGQGGNTDISLGTLSVGVSTSLGFFSGTGGAGGNLDGSGTAGAGGKGGQLGVTIGELDLGSGTVLNVTGGTGGSGGNAASGGTGGGGGAGGDVTLAIGSVTLATGNTLSVNGGTGGSGGTGSAADGAAGIDGQASVSIGDLEGAGSIRMGGAQASLSVGAGSFSGGIAGTETLEKTDSGSLTFSGSNYYSGGTSILSGTLAVDTGGTLGSGTAVNEAALQYIHSASASGSIDNQSDLSFQDQASAGSASVTNEASLSFRDDSTAGTASVDNQAGMTFQDDASAGAATLTTENAADTALEDSSSGGTARFILDAGGLLDVSLHSGAVTVGSLEGDGSVSLGSNRLAVGSNGLDEGFSGVLGGGGSLVKVGTGDWTLTGSSTYTGGTLIAEGTLSAGNSRALGMGSVTVAGGALDLAGAGSPLTLQLGGNYLQGPDGTLRLGLGGAGASSSDAVDVSGSAATLGGTLDLSAYGGLTALAVGQSVTVLWADSVSGMYQDVTESLGGGGRYLPVYGTDDLMLESIVASFEGAGATPNEKALGSDLDGIYGKAGVYGLVSRLGVMSDPQLRQAYGVISPADRTALYEAGFEEARARSALVGDRLFQFASGAAGGESSSKAQARETWFAANVPAAQEAPWRPPGKEGDWTGFLSGSGGFYQVEGDANADGYRLSSFGLTGAGAELRLSREVAVGILAGYNHTDATLGSGGSLSADGGTLGFYGLFASHGFYAGALADGGLDSYGTQRQAYGGTATARSGGSEIGGSLQLGYDWKAGRVSMGPSLGAEYTRIQWDAFQEQGSLSPLTYPAQGADSFLGSLGIRAKGNWNLGPAFLNPSLLLAWEKEFNDQGGSVQAGFGTGDGFTVAGPAIGSDGLLASAGLDLDWTGGWALSLAYRGEIGRTGLDSSRVDGAMSLKF
jgi:autotransporter-associated beta strand protein